MIERYASALRVVLRHQPGRPGLGQLLPQGEMGRAPVVLDPGLLCVEPIGIDRPVTEGGGP